MNLILSRKGFDSSPASGGCASPILPDDQMISLPIPYDDDPIRFSALTTRALDVGTIVHDLTGGRVRRDHPAHLDPDLDRSSRPRAAGWRPAFGQDGIAQRHLARSSVGRGDLFLFFGWFRRVERVRGRYRYVTGEPHLHVIFGWLRVGQVLRVGSDPIPGWLRQHPHVSRAPAPHNTIYVADGSDGGGVFPFFDSSRCLTEAGSQRRSVWRLPADFLPGSRTPLTYHREESRWTSTADGCRLQTVGKGQEFVLNLEDYPGVRHWADAMVRA